jgi:hypothetical protein
MRIPRHMLSFRQNSIKLEAFAERTSATHRRPVLDVDAVSMQGFEQFHPNSRVISIAALSPTPSTFSPKQRCGQQNHHHHGGEHEHLCHSRPRKNCINRSVDAVREKTLQVRYLILLDVCNITFSNFRLCIGSVLLQDRIEIPASDMPQYSYSTTGPMLCAISA